MTINYTTQGTCSKAIIIDVDDQTKTVNNVTFIGGCPGNTAGIGQLVKGMPVDQVIKRLEGIPCGLKRTSCPDQLARALKSIALVLIACFFLCLTSCQESKKERFTREAREYTERNCPQRITADGTIILDSLVYDDSNTMTYYYSVVSDSSQIELLREEQEELRKNIRSGIINSVELKHVKEERVTIVHNYRSTLGEEIFNFTFTPEDYSSK